MSHYRRIDGSTFVARCTVLWNPEQPDRIRLMINNPEMTDEDGERPGLQLVFSANPKSADYHPRYFNRAARFLGSLTLPHPREVPVRSRRIADRLASMLR
jgi:hypothetical protein